MQRVQPFVSPVPDRPDYRPAHPEGPVCRADVAVVVGQEVPNGLDLLGVQLRRPATGPALGRGRGAVHAGLDPVPESPPAASISP